MLEIELDRATTQAIAFPTTDHCALHQLRGAFMLQTIERLVSIRPALVTRHSADEILPVYDGLIDWLVNAPADEIEAHIRTPAFARTVMSVISRGTSVAGAEHEALCEALQLLRLMRHTERVGAAPLRLPLDRVPVGVWPFVGTAFALERDAGAGGEVEVGWQDGLPSLVGRKEPDPLASVRIVERRLLLRSGVEHLDADQFRELGHARQPGERTSGLPDVALDRMLAEALAEIASVWPAAQMQAQAFFTGLLPIAMDVENWNSASTNEIPFVLQLTFREGGWPLLLAESIVHEVSHVKLDMAVWISPIVEDDGRRDFRHPWRPDPRPISGVLYGAHAFLAVLGLYAAARERHPGDERIAREWAVRRNEVRSALDTLGRHASFTPFGRQFYDCLEDAFARAAS